MSWEATSAVIANSKQKGSGLLNMLIKGNYSDKYGYSWPSIRTVARDTRLSERTIQYLDRKAVECGELEVFPNQGPVITRGPATGQRTNLVRITLCEQPPKEYSPFPNARERKDCTTSGAPGGANQRRKVVQESPPGGASQRRKVVQPVASDPSGTVIKRSGSYPVDKSTASRTGSGRRQCTHLKCGPAGCLYEGAKEERNLSRVDFNRLVESLEVRAGR